jgi:hypothetical protein
MHYTNIISWALERCVAAGLDVTASEIAFLRKHG